MSLSLIYFAVVFVYPFGRDTREDWEKRRSIVQETVRCLDLMHTVFDNSNDDQCTDYG